MWHSRHNRTGRYFQQGGIVAAVGLMAIEAILHDGRMLKNERTPVTGVTIEAKFFIANSLYELGRSSPCGLWQLSQFIFPSRMG